MAGQFNFGYFVPHGRSIGGIIADVTIEESERDEVTVTEHPVEQGAPISDHAFKRAEEVIIRAGWSVEKTGDLTAESGIYGILLNWQASFVLFDLYTGKRRHKNMLINSLMVVTDQHSEYNLMATLSCREIILTKTETAQTSVSGNSSNHADPGTTSPPVDNGERQIDPVDPEPTQLNNALAANGGALDKGITTDTLVTTGAT